MWFLRFWVVPPTVLRGSFSPPLLHCKAPHPEQFLRSGLVKKQKAESLEPDGKQDQDTGELFLISTSLTGCLRFCSWTCVGWSISSSGSTCPFTGNDSNRI